MDKVAVAQFITETAFAYAYEIAGAVIALTVVVAFIILFKTKIIDLRRFYRV